ncbi:MAG: hypothetical protein JRJ44_05115 [Deltaproteobacteria bacterium]|nr:hypothetical protein [Deltaproteobacteria bacterium]
MPKTDYEKSVRDFAKGFGGFYNAHAHGDRAFTYNGIYYKHVGLSVADIEKLSLKEKQGLVWALHTGTAFTKESIRARMIRLLEDSIKYGIRVINSAIDVTYNSKFSSLEVAESLKKEYAGRIELMIGAYNVAGFKDKESKRFEIFEEAVKRSDFIVALAEKDRKKEHIGEEQHNVYMLKLGLKYNKPVHFHIGQANTPDEIGTELLFQDMDFVYNKDYRLREYPQNLLVHDISASCYDEEKFQKHCDNLIKYNLGVICCPSAALSMKQHSAYKTRIHNSIARIWDYAIRDIPVFFGTDNINDVFVPSSTPDLYDEIFLLSNALRGYNTRVLTKIACGRLLDNFDKGRIMKILDMPSQVQEKKHHPFEKLEQLENEVCALCGNIKETPQIEEDDDKQKKNDDICLEHDADKDSSQEDNL